MISRFSSTDSTATASVYKYFNVTVRDGVAVVRFDTPQSKVSFAFLCGLKETNSLTKLIT